ncbi:hypothetical protein EPICR_10287 [Candidatus Desulfarcum epimagneticum]|uniref:SMODS and SLOG-associating 2TM effector domain-containing protein n=1 Tax=uncultured Desulfobacteraceae bacterium TaxID=218296 RepID=A0A484HEA5_9BACT|nr:hypothetical protein EPICR_10287 [uncultured Desulfobacteraceae bacterium]
MTETAALENKKEKPGKPELKMEFLHGELDKSITKYMGRQKRNGKMGVIVKCLALGLSAIVTILLGLNFGGPPDIVGSIALIISACTGVVSGISAFFDFNELSLKYKDTADKLELLKIELSYLDLDGKAPDSGKTDFIKEKYIDILKETHSFFQSVRADDSDNTGKDTA